MIDIQPSALTTHTDDRRTDRHSQPWAARSPVSATVRPRG